MPEVCFSLAFRSSSFVLRSLLRIDIPPLTGALTGYYLGTSPRFPRGIIYGREGAGFIPVGKPRPRPPRARSPIPGALGNALGSKGGFDDDVGG